MPGSFRRHLCSNQSSLSEAIRSSSSHPPPPPSSLHLPPVAFTLTVSGRDVTAHVSPRGQGEHSNHWGSTCPVPLTTWGHYQVSSRERGRTCPSSERSVSGILTTHWMSCRLLANILLPFTAGRKVFPPKVTGGEEVEEVFAANKKRFWLWLETVLVPHGTKDHKVHTVNSWPWHHGSVGHHPGHVRGCHLAVPHTERLQELLLLQGVRAGRPGQAQPPAEAGQLSWAALWPPREAAGEGGEAGRPGSAYWELLQLCSHCIQTLLQPRAGECPPPPS